MTGKPRPTIYADFNNRIGNSLSLGCNGTQDDVRRLGIVLHDGLELRVSGGELAVDGIVQWSHDFNEWCIVYDNQAVEALSDNK